ncbi:MAG: thioredoxin domain-containing protein, partial [Myxococcota bacterium]
DTILGPDASKIVQAYFDVTNDGNFEGHSILHRPRTDAEIAQQLNIEVDALRQQIEKAKSTLYAARKKRIAPLLDDKIITEWNGQMISALARAGFALDDSKYISSAKKAADFILGAVSHEGRLRRAYRKGQARHAAVLEDYAFFIAGLLDLYEATSEQRWLQEAIRLQTIVDTHFLDADNGGYFATADDSPKLLVREKPIYDGAQPSGNSVSALNLLRLHTLTTDDKYRALAERVIFALGQTLLDGAVETPKLATALDFYYDEAKEIAVVGEGPERQALLDVLRKSFLPNRALSLRPTPEVPWTEDKRPMGGKPTAYVCLNQVCKKPTSDPKELERQLAEIARIEAEPLPISSQK